jgi:hypothetical protein
MLSRDREGFSAESGSLAPLRGVNIIYTFYRTYIVHSYARSRRLQSDISKTLVTTPPCQIAKNA